MDKKTMGMIQLTLGGAISVNAIMMLLLGNVGIGVLNLLLAGINLYFGRKNLTE